MTDIPSRDALIEAMARALCHLDGGNWRISNDAWSGILYREAAAAALDAILPLVLAGAGRRLGIDDATRLAIACGNADWDGERVCPTCDGKGYVDG